MAAPFVYHATAKHTATVIMAHGLGDTGAGWSLLLADNWHGRGKFKEVKFIFPNAPDIPITINAGTPMPGWYDIARLSPNMDLDEFMKNQDEAGMLKSRGYFNRLIKEEMDAGIPPSRIVMGGFSQGGAMALLTGITHPEKLGGIFALSCYTPLSNKLKDMLPESWPNKNVPVFVAHGDIDQVVRFELGQRSAQFLKDLGMNVDFRKYPDLGHAGRPDVTSDLAKYIRSILPPVEKKAQRPNGA